MVCVSIHRLSEDEMDEAWVLARLGDPGLTLKAWRARAKARNASPASGGVLMARDEEARPCGLAVYTVSDQPDGRRSLQVESLIAFSALDPVGVASALIAEVVRLARVVGCETLCLMRPLGQSLEVTAEVLASGVAVLPSLFWSSSSSGEQPTGPIDLGQGRRPPGLAN